MRSPSKQLRPFFTYYGGKYRVAPYYPKPLHDTIVEPFAGAAGYSLRYPERNIILADASPVISGVWRYLITADPDEILSLPDVADDQSVDDLALTQEQRWLIGFWLNKATTRPCKRPSAWMRQGTRPNSQWGAAIRARIAAQVPRIRHWKVIEGSYTKLDNAIATWFVDPPYIVQGRLYPAKVENYDHLSQWCLERQGQLIVCEADGATWLPFQPFREIKSVEGKNGSKKFKEAMFYRESN